MGRIRSLLGRKFCGAPRLKWVTTDQTHLLGTLRGPSHLVGLVSYLLSEFKGRRYVPFCPSPLYIPRTISIFHFLISISVFHSFHTVLLTLSLNRFVQKETILFLKYVVINV